MLGGMNLLQASLAGGAAFRDVDDLLADLDFAAATRLLPSAPYTVAGLLAHLRLTLRLSLDIAAGRAGGWPEDLDLWPAAPTDEAAFQGLLLDLRLLLAEAGALAAGPSGQAREVLTDLAVHNAYHWGQVALLRRMDGAELGRPAAGD
jgi:hypothetical protein